MAHFGLKPERAPRKVPVFPLSGAVLFPRILLPLHIFEPRYRAMVRDALAGELLIVTAIPRPGEEGEDPGASPLLETACLGRIVDHKPLADGRSNLLLLGLARVHLAVEVSSSPYRTFSVEILDDRTDGEAARLEERRAELQGLSDRLPREMFRYPNAAAALRKLSPTLGALSDLLADCLHLDPRDKRAILAELDILRRADRLAEAVRVAALRRAGAPVSPPPSVN